MSAYVHAVPLSAIFCGRYRRLLCLHGVVSSADGNDDSVPRLLARSRRGETCWLPVSAALLALGPLFQHTIDLNAWGQAAGMPLAFTAIGLGYAAMSCQKHSTHGFWQACVLALLSGVLFILSTLKLPLWL